MLVCPFCLGEHNELASRCTSPMHPEKEIPRSYIDSYKAGHPILFVMAIAYSGHGKTCFLSSLLYSLYQDGYANAWPGFSFLGLNHESLSSIHKTYVRPLSGGNLPPRTATMMPEPLILQFQNIPLKANSAKSLGRAMTTGKLSQVEQNEAIVVFYDIGGEIYDLENRVHEYLPILDRSNPLIFLIDLPTLIEEAQNGGSLAEASLHALFNNIHISLTDFRKTCGERRSRKKKGLDAVICFTKADRMWGNETAYGPLGKRLDNAIPPVNQLPTYLREMAVYSQSIQKFLRENYITVHNMITNNFNQVRFTATSSLGTSPVEGRVPKISPTRVFDPILWALHLNGFL